MVEYDFDIEKSKDGFNIIKIYKDNKKIYIGSKYNMKAKIGEFINSLNKDKDEKNVFLIFGIGSGECLSELNKLYPKSKIVIFEPNLKLINYIKQNPIQYKFLEKENVYLINPKRTNLTEGLFNIIKEYEITKVTYRSIMNYDKIYSNEFLEFTKIVKEFLSDNVISRNTNLRFSEIWFKTLINNLKYIIDAINVEEYKDKYKNIPAIIVSAGPSLSKNIDELKNISKDMLILSGGRTLKPLLEKEINPDLIGVVDPGEISYKLVKGYIDKCNVPLLFYEGTNSNVVRDHNGKKIIFGQSELINKILETNTKNLTAGGSIAHTLTMNAIFFGCNPIIFIGQDLAYTGEKFHSEIATNHFAVDKDNDITDKDGLYVEDINGQKVKTSEILDNFRRDFESIIKANKETVFIDATEGGAKIEGTTVMTLKEAIEKYKLNKTMNNIFKEEKINNKKSKVKENTINMLDESIKAIKFINIKCKEALRILDDLRIDLIVKESSKVNKSLKKLDKIDEEIKCKYKNLEILNNLLYPLTYSILTSYKAETDEDIINKNKFLYKSILEVINYALNFIEDELLQIKNMEI
ncbi:motility associated factor glycosyltransferase family protein [Clostridium niameyense]|uniref:motility associated factor glycosyltransferase family protein n=1 Tax=Clostridium niameyense TaxID=1622073 RepID=UPI00067EE848|nr:6-hydroxymethylpterin diphosphokinase MptE-like protein [Clostridium niameyense]